MAMRIGRLTGLNEPMDWSSQGDRVTLTAGYRAASLNDGIVHRDQLLGYLANPDEPVIPVVIDGETRINGFYRVLGVRILTDVFTRQRGNLYDYQLDLERISAGFQAPQIESLITGALMVNSSGVAAGTAEPFHAYPLTSAYEYTISVAYTIDTRYGTGQSPIFVRMNPNYKALARWATQPANFYDCAVVLANLDPVSHTVIGLKDSPTPYRWSIDNTLVHVTASNGGTFTLTWADTSNTFRTVSTIDFIGTTLGTLFPSTQLNATRVIRNAPEEVIVRVPCTSNKLDPTYIDVSVRRGSPIVRFYITTLYAAGDTWTWGNHASVASTAITGGQVWTANDGFGNRALLASAAAFTNTLGTGRITPTGTIAKFDAGVSFERQGTSSVNYDTAQSQVYQYFAAQAERMQVVGR